MKRKQSTFNPNRAYLENAIQEFIKNGGIIKKKEYLTNEDFERFISMNNSHDNTADQFLMA